MWSRLKLLINSRDLQKAFFFLSTWLLCIAPGELMSAFVLEKQMEKRIRHELKTEMKDVKSSNNKLGKRPLSVVSSIHLAAESSSLKTDATSYPVLMKIKTDI